MSTLPEFADPPPTEDSWPARIVDPATPRETLIASAAYYRAARRDFEPGHELEDWLAAEREIDGVGAPAD